MLLSFSHIFPGDFALITNLRYGMQWGIGERTVESSKLGLRSGYWALDLSEYEQLTEAVEASFPHPEK